MGHQDIIALSRATPCQDVAPALAAADFIFHMAGINRPPDISAYEAGNAGFTSLICRTLVDARRSTSIVFASSTQAAFENPYGRSKAAAEAILTEYGRASGASIHNLRLNNIFGKWSRPNYNSVVATFCYNIARDLPIRIDDPSAAVSLVYIDDVVSAMVAYLESPAAGNAMMTSLPVYATSVGDLAGQIRRFKASRRSLLTEPVGAGFSRALYATYVSHLPADDFSYSVEKYTDPRGTFVEMLKTHDSGQFSYFTAHPGVTRGGHYHHTKSEKFLVIRGHARFRFRHLVTNERVELETLGEVPQIVESVPGWAHDVTNVGADEMIVMLWANEIFDRNRPDTYKDAL
jgi:UDP-2-acetamido-2,6-beta-L-arabino-hexul-4-ose reductase